MELHSIPVLKIRKPTKAGRHNVTNKRTEALTLLFSRGQSEISSGVVSLRPQSHRIGEKGTNPFIIIPLALTPI